VAKAMAPAVVYIDDAEKVFKRQKNKKTTPMNREEEEVSPIRSFKKALLYQVKSLKPGDRVLVVGCSRNPANILLLF
jgi:hypothetical protein